MNKFVKIAFVTVFSAIAAFGIYQSQKDELQISELVLANAEALARYELPDVTITCNQHEYTSPGQCWKELGDCRRLGQYYRDCEFTGYQYMYCTTICNI